MPVKHDISKQYLKKKYIDEGWSLRDIAYDYGCSTETILRRLNKFGFRTKRQAESIIGQKFGMLLVQECSDKIEKYTSKYKCLCDCGNLTYPKRNNIICNITKSCGCQHRKCGKDHPEYMGYKDLSRRFWSNYINHAKERNLEFNITIEEAWNLYEKQGRKCALTGVDILLTDSRLRNEEQTASLDRKDSSKGYTLDNVQWVYKWVNICKWDLSQEEFILMANQIAKLHPRIV